MHKDDEKATGEQGGGMEEERARVRKEREERHESLSIVCVHKTNNVMKILATLSLII